MNKSFASGIKNHYDKQPYFYSLSEGAYEDYGETVIMHDQQFSLKEFAKMYNDVYKMVKEIIEYPHQLNIAGELCKRHGFKKVKPEFEIQCSYERLREITEKDIESFDDDRENPWPPSIDLDDGVTS